MSNMLHGSTFFCMAISLFGYEAGIFLRKKLKIGIFNPDTVYSLSCNSALSADESS